VLSKQELGPVEILLFKGPMDSSNRVRSLKSIREFMRLLKFIGPFSRSPPETHMGSLSSGKIEVTGLPTVKMNFLIDS
jgi:hypothetical protein